MLKLLGNALLVQHRVSGPVALAEKPDVLWDRPDLERLFARLEDEYELKERADALNRKLAVIADTAKTLADIIDARRSLRLELIVVVLIAFEIANLHRERSLNYWTTSHQSLIPPALLSPPASAAPRPWLADCTPGRALRAHRSRSRVALPKGAGMLLTYPAATGTAGADDTHLLPQVARILTTA
jgi:hypothetical protein